MLGEISKCFLSKNDSKVYNIGNIAFGEIYRLCTYKVLFTYKCKKCKSKKKKTDQHLWPPASNQQHHKIKIEYI